MDACWKETKLLCGTSVSRSVNEARWVLYGCIENTSAKKININAALIGIKLKNSSFNLFNSDISNKPKNAASPL